MFNFIMLLTMAIIILIPVMIKLWIQTKNNKYLVGLSIVLFVIGLAKLANYSGEVVVCAYLVMFLSPALPWLICKSNSEKFYLRITYYIVFLTLLYSYFFAYVM